MLVIANVRRVGSADGWPPLESLVLAGDRIFDVLPAGAALPIGVEVFDAGGALAIPGLVNAHTHTDELWFKGRFGGLPLEPYVVQNAVSVDPADLPTPDEVYQRTVAVAGEMLRNGVTGVADDVDHPVLTDAHVTAVLQGYADSGMRARVSIAVQDRTWRESLPFVGTDGLPAGPLDARRIDASAALSLYRRVAQGWSDPSARVGLMVSPSAAQRCTPGLLRSLAELSRDFELPFHVHVQESAAQYRSAPAMFEGRSAVEYLADLGCLGPRTTIAHAVWIDDRDLARVAEAGSTIAHNPVSNLRLGAGVARTRDFLDAGASVSLGTDGLTCNDSLDMLEVVKTALLLGSIAEADPDRWLMPAEVLTMATEAGARANFGQDVGTLRPGAKADIALLDPASFAFLPPNDAVPQVVNSARGNDVLHVFVDGRLVAEDGRACFIDEAAAAVSVRETAARLWESAGRTPQPQRSLIAPLRVAAIDALARSDEAGYRLVGRPPRLLGGSDGGD